MKQIFERISAFILSAGIVISCSGFLEEVNPVGLQNVYNSESSLDADMNGIYATVISPMFLEAFGSSSGLYNYGNVNANLTTEPRYVASWDFTQWSKTSENGQIFGEIYERVGRANNMIAALESSTVDPDFTKKLTAECRFVRAATYMWIVGIWGDVPLWLAPATASQAANCPKTKYDEVYRAIVEDLLYAQENMRGPSEVEERTPNTARPNKYAATAHLSTVYCRIGSLLAHPDDNFWDTSKPERLPDFHTGWPEGYGVKTAEEAYTKALEFAEKLIPESDSYDSGSPYKLVEKIQHLFEYSDSWAETLSAQYGYTSYKNPEMIYTKLNSMSSTGKQSWTLYTLPSSFPGAPTTTSTSNAARARPNRFVFQKWCQTYPGSMGTGDFDGMYQTSSDPRVTATLICHVYKKVDGTTVTPYPYALKTSQDRVFPCTKKYWSGQYLGKYVSTASIHYMRFAEVYLNAAEAAAYLNNEALARKYIGVLHKRARHSVEDGQPDATQPDWSDRTFDSKEDLYVAVFWERIFELLGEAKEIIDTHRFGSHWLADQIAKPFNDHLMLPQQSQFFGGTTTLYKGVQRRVYCEDWQELRKSLITPIPLTEIQSNVGIPTAENDFWWGL